MDKKHQACIAACIALAVSFYAFNTADLFIRPAKDAWTRFELGRFVPQSEIPDGRDASESLQRTRYVLEARLHPFFAIEGVDLANLEQAIKNLEASVLPLLPFYSATDQKEIMSSLYPIDFLTQLTHLERMRRALLADPSAENIETYHLLLVSTIRAYQQSTHRFAQSLGNSEAGSENPVYSLSGITDVEAMRTTMHILETSAEHALQEEERRYRCMNDQVQCAPLGYMSYSLKAPKKAQTRHVERTSAIEQEQLFEIRDLLDDIYEIFGADPGAWKREYMIQIHAPSCFSEKMLHYQLRWRDVKGAEGVQPVILDDIYFNDTSGSAPYLRSLEENGIALEYQPITNAYLCPDYGIDTARLLKTYAVFELLASEPNAPTLLEAAGVEVRLGDSMVSEHEIEDFLAALSRRMDQESRVGFRRAFGADALSLAETLLAIWHQGARFDAMVARLAQSNARVAEFMEYGVPSLPFLYLQRGYASIVFLPFNKTVVSEDVTFFKTKEQTPLHKLNLRSYRHDVGKTLTPQEVLDEVRRGVRALDL